MKISELNAIFRQTGLFQKGGLVIIKTISETNQADVAQKIAGLFCMEGETPQDVYIQPIRTACENEYEILTLLRETREVAEVGGIIMFYQQPMNKNRFPDNPDDYFSRYHTSLRIDNEADMSVFAYEGADGISIIVDKFRTGNQDIRPYILRRINLEE